MGEGLSARIGGRIASTHELDPLEPDPSLVRGPIKPSMLHYLTKEGDNSLSTCRGSITCTQINTTVKKKEGQIKISGI